MKQITVYLEAGKKRVFAGAIEWPGWCRSARDEDDALQALVNYGPRYAAAVRRAASGFTPPGAVSDLDVVERLTGNATTDFGAPGLAPAGDARPLRNAELKRQAKLLRACWTALDAAAKTWAGVKLRKGPRGGGRDLDAIVSHVLEADVAYLSRLGAKLQKPEDAEDVGAEMARLRKAMLETLQARAHGEPPPPSRRRTSPPWAPRYAIRRSAWHALDHAWEIEDRAMPSGDSG